MKIAFIGQKGVPAKSGGVEKHVEFLGERLVALGHEVTVYTRPHYTDPDIRTWNGMRLISLPTIRTKHLDAIAHTLVSTLHALRQDYDVIHYQSIGPSSLSFIPKLLKRSARVVATFHSPDYGQAKWGGFAKWCLRRAEHIACTVPDRTITVSRGLRQYARERYGVDVAYIPNGAKGEPITSVDSLRSFGLREKRYILSVSRLVGHKGIHHLIRAFIDLDDTGRIPNRMKLVIVGTHAESAAYERRLHAMSAGRDNIVFLGEQTGRPLEELFSHAGMFVQPSESEGLSIALLEAMSYGLPIVSSDIPENREALDGAGVYFESKDVESLKRELAYLISREDEMRLYGTLAAARARNHFSWDAIAKQTAEVYEDAVRSPLHSKSYAMEKRHS